MEYQSQVYGLPEYKSKFDEIIQFLISINCQVVDVVFGFTWGCTIYAGDWISEPIDLKNIWTRINEIERAGHGKFGYDEITLIIQSENLEILFCHENDIHLEYTHETRIVQSLMEIVPKIERSNSGDNDGT